MVAPQQRTAPRVSCTVPAQIEPVKILAQMGPRQSAVDGAKGEISFAAIANWEVIHPPENGLTAMHNEQHWSDSRG